MRTSLLPRLLPSSFFGVKKGLRQDGPPLGFLLLFTLAFYRQITLQGLILADYDPFSYFYPMESYFAAAIQQGHLPLWNPYLFTGAPFLANLQPGILYPFNLIFLLFPAPHAYAYSLAFHVFLMSALMYAFARRGLALGPLGALTAALVLAFGGFVSGMSGHINQVQAMAWLPLLFLLVHMAWERPTVRIAAIGAVVFALQILAGHSQVVYLSAIMLGAYTGYKLLTAASDSGRGLLRLGCLRSFVARSGATLAVLALGLALGAGLAAAQLLPTLELIGHSIRAGGLTYKEATTFSLPPWLLPQSLLPPYGRQPLFSEWLGYVGMIGLLLAAVGLFSRPRRNAVFFAGLAAVGLFLALGQYNPIYAKLYRHLPALDSFRVPARWLLLYAFGTSALAGLGMDILASRLGRPRGLLGGKAMATLASVALAGLSLLLATELVWASKRLSINQGNLVEAYTSLRPALAHLLADGGLFRVLPFTEATFDPGDLREMKEMVAEALPPERAVDYVTFAKDKETLKPNLPLTFGVPSLDGTDGGLLPLKRYVEFKSVLPLRSDNIPDGRLREQLSTIPDPDLLGSLNVKYVLTDRLQDAWAEGIYYDLGVTRELGPQQELTLDRPAPFRTTALGIISYVSDATALPDGTEVGTVALTDDTGAVFTAPLRVGVDTAEGNYEPGRSLHQQPPQPTRLKPASGATVYVGKVALPRPAFVEKLTLRYTANSGKLSVKGLSLIDGRTGSSYTLALSDSLRLVHVGDVKIYENLAVRPRAFAVHEALVADNDAGALALMKSASFQPQRQAVLLAADVQGTAGRVVKIGTEGPDEVEVVEYLPERVRVRATLPTDSLLLLTDSYYPGWRARVDGREVPILRANYLFRAIRLPAGEHSVEFSYEPDSFRNGLIISVLALVVVAQLTVGSRGVKWWKERSAKNSRL